MICKFFGGSHDGEETEVTSPNGIVPTLLRFPLAFDPQMDADKPCLFECEEYAEREPGDFHFIGYR